MSSLGSIIKQFDSVYSEFVETTNAKFKDLEIDQEAVISSIENINSYFKNICQRGLVSLRVRLIALNSVMH
jgi:hypothetical protein